MSQVTIAQQRRFEKPAATKQANQRLSSGTMQDDWCTWCEQNCQRSSGSLVWATIMTTLVWGLVAAFTKDLSWYMYSNA